MNFSDSICSRFFTKSHGGVRLDHRKNTKNCETVIMPPPEKVIIPMQQHIGAPCTPCVAKGDYVYLGQKIGDSEAFVSAPIHASVSGTVEGECETTLANGMKVKALIINSDGKMERSPDIKPHTVNSRDDLVKAARECGLVGLGGAGFPTHVKLKSNPDKPIDTLIINAAECEPYITTDYRECVENSEHLMEIIYILYDFLAVDRIVIAIEDNKSDAAKILRDIAAKDDALDDRVQVKVLKSKYPQGAEKVIVKSVTGRKVPMGALPSDVGCAVMNITSVSQLGTYIKTGMPLVSKRLTVDGGGVANPMNVVVPIGTQVKDVIAFCGGYKSETKKLLFGGPMMGLCMIDDEASVTKQNNAILVLDTDDAPSIEATACIRCGRCAAVCPMSLMPTLIERYAKIKDVDSLKKIGVGVCMECGSCAYSCPAHRPLVQYMRLAKTVVKEEGK